VNFKEGCHHKNETQEHRWELVLLFKSPPLVGGDKGEGGTFEVIFYPLPYSREREILKFSVLG
jgi:hypothetical protein